MTIKSGFVELIILPHHTRIKIYPINYLCPPIAVNSTMIQVADYLCLCCRVFVPPQKADFRHLLQMHNSCRRDCRGCRPRQPVFKCLQSFGSSRRSHLQVAIHLVLCYNISDKCRGLISPSRKARKTYDQNSFCLPRDYTNQPRSTL